MPDNEIVRFLEMANMPWCSGIRKLDWGLGRPSQMIQSCNRESEVNGPRGAPQAIHELEHEGILAEVSAHRLLAKALSY